MHANAKLPLHSGFSDQLCSEIVNGVIPADTVLTLGDIAGRFKVSRTVAREVTQSLEEMRLVVTRRRVGNIIQPQSSWDVLNPRIIESRLAGYGRDAQLESLTQLRLGIEPVAAAAAATQMDGKATAELMSIADRMQVHGRAGKLEAFMALDNKLHDMILKGSGNEMFGALSETVLAAISGRAHIGMMPQHPRTEAMDLHSEVAYAIGRRDPKAAESAMRNLLEEVCDTLRKERK